MDHRPSALFLGTTLRQCTLEKGRGKVRENYLTMEDSARFLKLGF